MEIRNRKFLSELIKKPRLRKESGLFIIDGPKMAAEVPPELAEEIYITKDFLSSPHAAECEGLLTVKPYTVVDDSAMKKLSDTVNPQGIIVVARQMRYKGFKGFMEAQDLYARSLGMPAMLLILETIQDPGNLGTIMRSAEAAGVSGILSNDETVDLYSPKVIRATMGAIFRMPYISVNDLGRAVMTLKTGELTDGKPVSIYAAHLGASVEYTEVSFTGDCAVMIGNESSGLSAGLCELSDKLIHIPMMGGTESLNAAAAASVISFEALRQRRLAHKKENFEY